MKTDLGKRIKKYRKEVGYTQETFAEKIDMTTSFVSSIERGERTPSMETFIKMTEVLDISADLLLGIERENDVLPWVKYMDEQIRSYPVDVQERIHDVVETMLNYEIKTKKK